MPVADPDPAVELGARSPAGPLVEVGVLVGRADAWGHATEVGKSALELDEQGRPLAVISGAQGGQHRRRDLELDDRGAAPPRPVSAAGAGWSAPGEQDVLEVPVAVG